jgi:hypothetical protein
VNPDPQIVSFAVRVERPGGVDGLVILYPLTDSEITMYSGSEKRIDLSCQPNDTEVGFIITEPLDNPTEVQLKKGEMYNYRMSIMTLV